MDSTARETMLSAGKSEDFQQFLNRQCTKIDDNEIINSKIASSQRHYLYKGCVVPEFLLRGYFESFKMKFYDEDIILTSFPKTGTTWAQELVYLVYNEGDETKINSLNLEERFPYIELMTGLVGHEVEKYNELAPPRLFKSHMPYSQLPGMSSSAKYKIIYICRNAKDTAVSLYHFYRMNKFFNFTGTLSELVELFVNDLVAYSPYGKHVIEFWDRSKNDKNILFLQYEELQHDIKGNIKLIAAFLGKHLSDSVVDKIAHRCSFAQMSIHPTSNYSSGDGTAFDFQKSKFMRKGTVGDWKNHFSEEDNRKMELWIERNFGKSDIKFVYE